jgi:hypothetical protein
MFSVHRSGVHPNGSLSCVDDGCNIYSEYYEMKLYSYFKAIVLTTLLLARETNPDGIQYACPRDKKFKP